MLTITFKLHDFPMGHRNSVITPGGGLAKHVLCAKVSSHFDAKGRVTSLRNSVPRFLRLPVQSWHLFSLGCLLLSVTASCDRPGSFPVLQWVTHMPCETKMLPRRWRSIAKLFYSLLKGIESKTLPSRGKKDLLLEIRGAE